jgi:O-methyltransferase
MSQPEDFSSLHPNLLIGIHRALSRLTARGQAIGGYYEFGLYRGFSFWFANNLAQDLGLKLEFHGFDSFEGLPPSNVDIHRNWQPGSYACGLEQVTTWLEQWKMPLPYRLHKGWFSAELFAGIEKQYALPAPTIVVIDSDLYESATEVLRMLAPRLRVGVILLFDDFNAFAGDNNHGERRALSEFESNHPSFRKTHLFSFGPYGEAFEVSAL